MSFRGSGASSLETCSIIHRGYKIHLEAVGSGWLLYIHIKSSVRWKYVQRCDGAINSEVVGGQTFEKSVEETSWGGGVSRRTDIERRVRMWGKLAGLETIELVAKIFRYGGQ